MKASFSWYYRPTPEAFESLWAEGTFIFDTNVLLNLYSYPEAVREVYFSVLEKIGQRIWIPYHVGLEFHRNRINRIKQENARIRKLLTTITDVSGQLREEINTVELEKRNLGVKDMEARLKSAQEAHDSLREAVQIACEKLPSISLDDPIGDRIARLLEGKVGSHPHDQAALDALVVDAKDRYENKIPPGFSDAGKDGSVFFDRDIAYQRQHGDLIIWRQIIDHAKTQQIGKLVFVTGDNKRDWWWSEDGKTLGPNTALLQEMNLKASTEQFWIYSADQFLTHAENYLRAREVTPEAIQQVKEISKTSDGPTTAPAEDAFPWEQEIRLSTNDISPTDVDLLDFMSGDALRKERGEAIEHAKKRVSRAVGRWLRQNYENVLTYSGGMFDYVVFNDNITIGYQILSVSNVWQFVYSPAFQRVAYELNEKKKDAKIRRARLVVAIDRPIFGDKELQSYRRVERALAKSANALNLDAILVGHIDGDDFQPIVIANRGMN
ncbi:PIN-like domain-containing protein [Dongia rigui]|uniref:PIN-like domain-containing protein n=1 Tax=Dongia rigui TaxID=940149 RepID=A0ABU5DYF3_9PROT|nr:PIN-like domain-containing protein [Dongia rigui]MDY0872306.1 PIN-like domain-containing protein [Dongia rigui]